MKFLAGGTSGEWKFILNLRAFLIDNSNNKLLGNEEDYYFLCDDPYDSCYPILFLQWEVS